MRCDYGRAEDRIRCLIHAPDDLMDGWRRRRESQVDDDKVENEATLRFEFHLPREPE